MAASGKRKIGRHFWEGDCLSTLNAFVKLLNILPCGYITKNIINDMNNKNEVDLKRQVVLNKHWQGKMFMI